MATLDSRTAADVRAQSATVGQRLRGWKEIGRYFGVDERTAKRWEAQRGLPVHRVPGEPRAPVFAYTDELTAWVAGDRRAGTDGVASELPAFSDAARRPWLAVALLCVVLLGGASVWLGLRGADDRRLAASSVEDLKRLAGAQVAAVNDQLDSPPGTLAVRAALAGDAVEVLGRVAATADVPPALRREAAEGYRRLAVLQNAVDRPSLRDRAGARLSLQQALSLLDGDRSAEAALVRAKVQIEAAEQASGDGKHAEAARLLAAARPAALGGASQALADAWWLADSARAGWNGDHAATVAAARRVSAGPANDVPAALRQVRALDLEAEGLYYLGDLAGAEGRYRQAVATADSGFQAWPQDNRMRWAVLRQQWNLGSTMAEGGDARQAVPILRDSLGGWERLAEADPSDEAVQAWVHAVRLSLGQALGRAGDSSGATAELSRSVAERRAWLSAKPADADRRRMLLKSQAALADALATGGRAAEACALLREADGVVGSMAMAEQLTGFDREQTLKQMEALRRTRCGAGAAAGA